MVYYVNAHTRYRYVSDALALQIVVPTISVETHDYNLRYY